MENDRPVLARMLDASATTLTLELKLSKAMVFAGANVLVGYNPNYQTECDTAIKVFTEMLVACVREAGKNAKVQVDSELKKVLSP